MTNLIGRQISYGLGVESTRGTAVAPDFWVRHLSADVWTKTDKIFNESANGNVVGANQADIARQWSEGTLEAKVQSDSFGVVLYGALGAVSTDGNADASGNVYDHTFTLANSTTPKSLTIAQKSANADRAYALAVVNSFGLKVEAGEYATFELGVMAKKHASASNTVAYTSEDEFTSKHASVKFATNVAGLSGATAISVESVSLNIARNVEPYWAHGSVEPAEINGGRVDITGSMVLRWDSETYENLFYNNTNQAVEIELVNTDVTIGTAANPTITITMPTVSIESIDVDQSLDSIVKQTVNFNAMFDATTSKAIDIVLTNETSSY